MTFTYDSWIEVQSRQIETAMRQSANAGRFDQAIFVIPSEGSKYGRLVLADEKPDGATDVLTFPAVGTRVSSIPYSSLYNAIWNACRRMPICPTA